MSDILNISFVLQAMLVFGYLSFYVSTVGVSSQLNQDDRIFQVLTFGFIGWSAGKSGVFLFESFSPNLPELPSLAIQVALMAFSSFLAAIIWRKSLRRKSTAAFRKLGIHTQDHFPNTLATLNDFPLLWDYIQLHMKDGRTIESDFNKVTNSPTNPIVIDPEGNIAIYVTKIYRPDDSEADFTPELGDRGHKINYYRNSEINSIEICWRQKPT